MQTAGRISGLVIQALRFLRKPQVDTQVITKLRSQLTDEEKQQLLKDIQFAPAWIGDIFQQLTEVES